MKNEIGFNIRSLRREKGLSQEKLANLCKISMSYLQMVESGNAKPTEAMIASIYNALGVEYTDIPYLMKDI